MCKIKTLAKSRLFPESSDRSQAARTRNDFCIKFETIKLSLFIDPTSSQIAICSKVNIFVVIIAIFSDTSVMNYPGGKGKIYQKLISIMPKHQHYIELFLGNGKVFRHKKPAKKNIGIEIDEDVILNYWNHSLEINQDIINCDVFDFLKETYWMTDNAKETLIYADPPYLRNVRSSKGKLYRYELMEEYEHENLLHILKSLPCNVMISGYESDLYNKILINWRKESFNSTNRAGHRTIETVWMNFPKPLELHDYQYLGNNARERERIKRKRQRWEKRLLKMDSYEKFALLSTIEELKKNHETSL